MMTGLGPLLASFLALDIASFTRKMKRNIFFYALAVIFLLTAYVLAVASLAVYLGQTWGMPAALLAVAGGAFVAALLIFAWAAAVNRAEERRKREVAAANSGKTLMVTAGLSALPLVMKSRPLLLVSAAAGFGFLAMKMIGRRSTRDEPPV